MNDDYQLLPSATEAEQSLLGALMLYQTKIDNVNLSAADFFNDVNSSLYAAMLDLHEIGVPFDAVSLGDKVPLHASYAIDLQREAYTDTQIEAHAAIIADKAARRRLIGQAEKLRAMGFNCVDTGEIISTAIGGLSDIAATMQDGDKEPLDLFGDYELPVLKPDYLPPGIARYASDRAEIMGTAPEIISISAITTAAAAIHDRIVIKPKSNEPWIESARLWCMVVAAPGSKKSSAQKLSTKPMRRINDEISYGFAAKMAEYDKACQVARLKLRKSVKREANGDAELGYDEPEQPIERPPNRLAIIQDGTSAAVCDALCDNERGMLWYVDELVVWFGLHEAFKDGGMSRGIALQAYEGGPYRQMRVGRGMVNVPNLSYSVLGSTQPEKIRALMNKSADDGLMQRFMVIEIPQKVFPDEEEREIDHVATKAYEENIQRLWNLQPPQEGHSVVHLGPDANEVRKEFFAWVKLMANNAALPSMLRGHLAKWEGLWPRLALVYHAYGCVNTGKHPSNLPLQEATAKRVTALMKNYLFPQALRFYRDTLAESDEVYRAAKLASAMILAEHLTRVTNRQLHHGVNAWRHLPDFKKQSVVSLLMEAGWLMPTGASGDKSSWVVNQRVHTLYAERAAVERARRAASAETMAELRRLQS